MAPRDVSLRFKILRLRRGERVVHLRGARLVGSGGEGSVFALPGEPDKVVKLYHRPTPEHAAKLEVMLAAPPEEDEAGGHRAFAWPLDVAVHQGSGKLAGFVMPRVARMRPIFDFYNPETRRREVPLFSHRYLHRAGRNLAAAMSALHARGHVMGDVNESNVLTSDAALVTLVDCDSFQVRDPATGAVHRCRVGRGEYTPPELQGKSFPDVDRAPEHDLFGLAVVLYLLLMEGAHPFAGIFQGVGEAPTYEQRISSGLFPFARRRRAPVRPAPVAPPFEMLHPLLRDLFVRCFEDGHRDPRARPTAREWQETLEVAEDALVPCKLNAQHVFGAHVASCPWCERKALLKGRDPFPSAAAVARGEPSRWRPLPRRKPTIPRVRTQAPWVLTLGSGGRIVLGARRARTPAVMPATSHWGRPVLSTVPRSLRVWHVDVVVMVLVLAFVAGRSLLERFTSGDSARSERRRSDAVARADSGILMDAAKDGNLDVVRQQLELGADPNASRGRHTVLMAAASGGNVHVVEELLEAGARPARTNASGATALMVAARAGHSSVVAILARHGGCDQQDAEGRTALMLAAASGNLESVRHLTDCSYAGFRDDSGRTALDHARANGYEDVVALLESTRE